MRRMVVLAACTVVAASGGAEASVAQAPPPQFAAEPVVVTSGSGVHVWVRLNRPLRDNEGTLGEREGASAELEIAGTTRDIPGLYRDDRYPTCYGQYLDGEVAESQVVDVSLELGAGQRLAATVQAQSWPDVGNVDVQAITLLGCPADPATRRCSGSVSARYVGVIGVRSATNTSCRRAKAVMRSVGRWANSGRCYQALCVSRHRRNRGYRCSVDLVGEAAWQITCTRGKRIVRGYTAD